MTPDERRHRALRGGGRRPDERRARAAARDPASRYRTSWLRAARSSAADCGCAEPLARRSARRGEFLSSFSRTAGRAAHDQAVPRRSVPGDEWRCAGGIREAAPADRIRRDARRWQGHARSRVLPRQLRLRAIGDDRWRNLRGGSTPKRSRTVRTAGACPHERARQSLSLCRAMPARFRWARMPSPAQLARECRRRELPVRIVRNGSRGLYWLEPLIEVVTPAGRVAYGPVRAADVPALLDAGLLDGGPHALRLGDIENHEWLRSQQRLTAARLGVVDPADIDDYIAHGGYAGLSTALAMPPQEIVRAVTDSGLRGRGGAAFPTGHQVADRPRSAGRRRSTSPAMRTRAIRERSRIACSWKAIRSRSSKA